MDGQTPYAPRGAPVGGGSGSPGAGSVDAAARTRPWVTLIAVLATLVTILMFALTAFMTIMITMGGEVVPGVEGIAAGLGFGAVYLLLALLYAVVTLRLWRMRKAIGGFVAAASDMTLEQMLVAHMSFWRTIGLIAAVILVIYAAMFVLGIGAAIFAGLAGG